VVPFYYEMRDLGSTLRTTDPPRGYSTL
jgi:hypothetical protein